MKSKLSRGSVIAALDIGSSKITCFIGRVIDEEGGVEIVGVGHQASKGIKSGTITDLEAAENAVRQTVHAAENMAGEALKGYPLREVVVNVPGVHAKSHAMSADIKVMGQEISDNDVRRALVKAQNQVLSNEHELIHTIAVDYRIDNNDGIRDPRGMVAQNLDVGIHMVTALIGPMQNFATCIERSHLDITALCSASYAAGLATLVEDEMDLGCTVIDMGGGVTSLAVFQNGKMIFSDAVPVGGTHVTHDIATGLGCSTADAERIKTLYGSAMATNSDESEMIEVPQMGEDGTHAPNHIPRSLLVGIIQPRVEETLEMVREKLRDSGLAETIGRRVVLTGGASQLNSMRELAQLVLDKQVRLGRPIRIASLPDGVSSPAFATSAGLLTYVTERQDEMPAVLTDAVEGTNLWARFKYWWKENW